MDILGIDIGGTGIKAAIVDTDQGTLRTERLRVLTPHPSTPSAVSKAVARVVQQFDWKGPIGCTFPAIVSSGVIRSAANVDKGWIGLNGQDLLSKATGRPVVLLNDADAAGIAELRFGAGRGQPGLVILLTLGTGIGSALLYDGRLVPNAELGHLEIRGRDAEKRCSEVVRQKKKMSWKRWARRLNEYLNRLEFLFSPDLFIIGGGASHNQDKFLPRLKTRAPVVVAHFLNEAGIIGAALAAADHAQKSA